MNAQGSVRRRFRRVGRAVARLSPLLRRRRWTIVAIAGSSAGAGVAEAGVLALVAYIASAMSRGIDHTSVGFGPIHLEGIPTLLGAAAVLALLRLGLKLVAARLPARLSGEVQTRLRNELFGSYLDASWSAKAQEKEGRLQELMGGQATTAGQAVLQMGNGLSAALMFVPLAAAAFVLSPGVAALVLVTAAVLFAGLRPLSRRVRRRAAASSAASLGQASGVAESVRMAEEVEAFGTKEAARSVIDSLVTSLEAAFVRTKTLAAIVPVLYQSAVIFFLVGGLALLYAMGASRLAALGAVVLLLLRASAYGQQFQAAYQNLGESLPYMDRVLRAVEGYRGRARPPGHRPIDRIRTVEFESVGFGYRAGAPVLHEVSFSIRAGEAVGVVGPTGAGKSTLLQVLLRLQEPTGGTYLVNNVPAGEIEDASWHRKIAYLPQEPHLLGGSVADNIRFHREWISDEAVERAARLAHIHDDISSWDEGYRTIVGQRASAVSGGQRQRLCLARALAGAPDLLLLDEPTSALDLRSERLIQDSLEGLRGTLTLVVVAHRLTTLSLCDRVMVIRDGRLEAFAPAQLLYDSNEFYRRAVDLAAAGNPL